MTYTHRILTCDVHNKLLFAVIGLIIWSTEPAIIIGFAGLIESRRDNIVTGIKVKDDGVALLWIDGLRLESKTVFADVDYVNFGPSDCGYSRSEKDMFDIHNDI